MTILTHTPSAGGPDSGPHSALRAYEETLNQGHLVSPQEFLDGLSDQPAELIPALQEVFDAYNRFSLPAVPGYVIVGELGRGGMSVVYLAKHQDLGRLVALKMLRPWPTPSAEALMRFEAEARAVARLSHPNVVRLFEAGRAAGSPYLALEYVPGVSLAERLGTGPLAPREAAHLLLLLARALQHAHDEGVLHRDVKPGNVLLAPDGTPRLADFGLAKLLDADSSHTRSGQALGTLAYAAPEQTLGGGRAGAPADVYGLGAVLYECLTGQPPFGRGEPAELLTRIRSEEPAPPRRLMPDLSRDLEAVCLRCLEKEPARRYATARELADDLERFLAGDATAARPLTRLGRLARWVARRRRPLTLTVLALALGAATGLAVGGVLLVRAYQHEARLRRDAEEGQRLTLESIRELSEVLRLHVRHEPGKQREEIRSLQTALRIAEEAAARAPASNSLRAEVALLTLRLAEAEEWTGNSLEAVRLYGQSTTLLRELVRERPADRQLRWQLVTVLTSSGQRESESSLLQEARAHLAVLLAAEPDRPEYLDRRVWLLLAAAKLRIEAGLYEEAERLVEDALLGAEALRQRFPTGHPLSHIRCCLVLEARTGVAWWRRDWDAAERALREMCAVDARLAEEYPNGPLTNRTETMSSRVVYAELLLFRRGQDADAARELDRALADLRLASAKFPDVDRFRRGLEEAAYLRGVIYFRASEEARAKAAFAESFAALRRKKGLCQIEQLMRPIQAPFAEAGFLAEWREAIGQAEGLPEWGRPLLLAMHAFRSEERDAAARLADIQSRCGEFRATALYALAIARQREGRAKEARECFRLAEGARVQPGGHEWGEAVIRLEAARLLGLRLNCTSTGSSGSTGNAGVAPRTPRPAP